MPAKAGIQKHLIFLDSGSPPAFAGVGRNDARNYSANSRDTILAFQSKNIVSCDRPVEALQYQLTY
jgi:hypothetical protein